MPLAIKSKPVLIRNARRPSPAKIDPSRTFTLRRKQAALVRARFNALRKAVRKLVADEDAFGLKARAPFDPAVALRNVFCPTGEGGGVDPSCSPNSKSDIRTWENLPSFTPHATVKDVAEKDGLSPIWKITPKNWTSQRVDGSATVDRGGGIIGISPKHVGDVGVQLHELGHEYWEVRMSDDGKEAAGRLANWVRKSLPIWGKGIVQNPDKNIRELENGERINVGHGGTAAKKSEEIFTQLYSLHHQNKLSGQLAAAFGLLMSKKEYIFNAFCPTGEGGGVDPSCSPGDPQGAGRALRALSDAFRERTHAELKAGVEALLGALPGKDLKAALAAAGYDYLHVKGGRGRVVEEVVRALQDRKASWDRTAFNAAPTTNAGRFAFRSSQERVRAFQAWLAAQFRALFVNPKEEELWRRYAEAGYRKGAGRAFDDVKNPAVRGQQGKTQAEEYAERPPGGRYKTARGGFAVEKPVSDFYRGGKEEFLRSAFGRPVAVEKVKLMAGRSFDDLKNVTTDMSARMSRVLTDAIVEGKSPREAARDLDKAVDLAEGRALVIARTEIIRAHSEGQLDAMELLGVPELGVEVEWSTTGDDKVCPLCEDMEGKVFTVEEARGMIPRHPNCLPGDALVLSRSGVAAASKRWFDGDLVVVRLASGREIACTPNHPILAEGGWVGAQFLHVGDRVVCDGGREWEPVLGDNQHENVPALIHQVAEAFGRAREVTAAEVPTAAPDFHGDGRDGDVAVVWSYGQLGLDAQAARAEHRDQSPFVFRRSRKTQFLSASGLTAEFIERRLAPATRFVGTRDLRLALCRRHLGPLERLGGALVANGHARQLQHAAHRAAGDAVAFGDEVFGHAADVQRNDLVRRQVDARPDVTVLAAEDAVDDLERDAELARQIAGGASGPVFLDDVVSVRLKRFAGHVYNLETGEGFYAANGIITHNCRCAFTPRIPRDLIGNRRRNLIANFARLLNVFCPTGPGGGVDPSCSPGEGAGSSVPPPDKDLESAKVRQTYIDDAKRTAENETVQRRAEKVAQTMAENDARWSKVQEKIAAMEDKSFKLESKWNAENLKLQKLLDEDLASMKRGEGSVKGPDINMQGLKVDEALGKFLKYRREMDDKAWGEIRKHVNSEETVFERGVHGVKNFKLAENTSGDPSRNLSESQRASVREVEKRLSGSISGNLRHRLDATDVRGLRPDEEQRAYFKGTRHGGDAQSIHLPAGADESTVAHELGHSLETNLNVHAAAQGFLYMRVGTEAAKPIEGKTFKAWEVGRDDDFGKAFGFGARYVGKHYKSDDTEVVSMGLEKMYNDPVRFAKQDPQYFKFMLGMLDGSFA